MKTILYGLALFASLSRAAHATEQCYCVPESASVGSVKVIENPPVYVSGPAPTSEGEIASATSSPATEIEPAPEIVVVDQNGNPITPFEKLPAYKEEKTPNPSRPDKFLPNPTPKSVRFVWLVPSDNQADPATEAAINTVAKSVQDFFKNQLGGKTFILNDPTVEIMYGNKDGAWYQNKEQYLRSEEHLKREAATSEFDPKDFNGYENAKVALEARIGNVSNYRWVIFVGARLTAKVYVATNFRKDSGTSAAIFPQRQIDCMIDPTQAENGSCHLAVAHETAHMFRVDHNDDNKSVMYPTAGAVLSQSYFLDQEKQTILTNAENAGYLQ